MRFEEANRDSSRDSDILPDVLRPGLRVVFCGMAAGTISAARRAYYAGPGNRFWPILAETGLTPRRLAPQEFRMLTQFGIGLTDIVKTACGRDAALPREAFDITGFINRIRNAKPKFLAFNGKKAAACFLRIGTGALAYGRADVPVDFPPIYVLPSTSGAASGFWNPKHWYDLGQVGDLKSSSCVRRSGASAQRISFGMAAARRFPTSRKKLR